MVLEYSFPCVLEILPLTYECPHPHCLSFNCSPSLPFTKTTMENQPFQCRYQVDFPSQPLFLNDFTSKFNRLTHSYNYISPIFLWMEDVFGGINQHWYILGLIFHDCTLILVPNLGVTKTLPDIQIIFDISMFWIITCYLLSSRGN
jgi:hypothetical protein